MLVGGYVNIALVTLQGLLLVPIALSSVGASVYGAWLGSGNIIGWLGVLEMGTASIMIQRIASAIGRGDKRSAADYFSTGLAVQLVLMLLFMVGALAIAPFFPEWMSIRGQDARNLSYCFVLAAFANSLSLVNNAVAGFAQALQKTTVMNVAAAFATIVGFVVSLACFASGMGLWSLPIGMTVRSITLLAANALYVYRLYLRDFGEPLRVDRAVLRDFSGIAGPVFLSNLGNAAMGKSDVALVAMILQPEVATIYALTRRAAEVVMMLLDRTGAAVYGGFAHLVGSGALVQARAVYHEVLKMQSSLAILMLSVFFAFNASFVSLWVGGAQFGGSALNVLVGTGTVMASLSGTMGYLYGATGKIAHGSYVIIGESVMRFLLMIVLLSCIGIIGLPAAAILTTGGAGIIYYRRTIRELQASDRTERLTWRSIAVPGIALIAGVMFGLFLTITSWSLFVWVLSGYTVLVSATFLLLDPIHFVMRDRMVKWIRCGTRFTS